MFDCDGIENAIRRAICEAMDEREPTIAEQRQAFIDEAAMRYMTAPWNESVCFDMEATKAYGAAEALWDERQRRIEAEGREG